MLCLVTPLFSFGLRQVIGEGVQNVVEAVQQRFRDHSQSLPQALAKAHDRAWQALAVALAGDGFVDRVKVFFAAGDDKGVREQVQLFLKGNALSFTGTPADFRQTCLDELKRLRKSGLLSAPISSADVGHQAGGFARRSDPNDLIEEARRAVEQVADALAQDYRNLATLIRTPVPGGPPLLAAAFCYFFRREVETDDELAHGLFFDGLRQMTAAQAKAFGEVNKALATLGDHFDQLFEQLDRIEIAVADTHIAAVATHGAVLDLHAEMQRLGGLHLASADEIRALIAQVQQQLSLVGMQRGEVRPHHSFSIRGADERRAVHALLARLRNLPAADRAKVPALLNGLGKLQVGAGEFTGARETFAEVATVVNDPSGKAEASYNAYRAALEERKWDAALDAIRHAAALEPQRFAPFPLHRYQPKRILGAGGFGTAVLCHDDHFDEDVVVKALHGSDLERGLDDVFREARLLRRLSHPAIIDVRDCEYADPAAKARPYLVMDYVPGGNLEQIIEESGTLTPDQLVPVATQIARGMQAAHGQGVWHRDLKPANVLASRDKSGWQVKIIDFGLALRKSTIEASAAYGPGDNSMMSRSVAGTLQYAPPEQMGRMPGVKPGPYSDVYAFGKTCCYALFKTTEPRSRHLAGLPAELRELLERCIEQELNHRYASFNDVLAALEMLDPMRRKAAAEAERERERLEQERLFYAAAEESRRRREQAARERRDLEAQQSRAEAQRGADEDKRRADEEKRRAEQQRREREAAARRQQQEQERQKREQERQQHDLARQQREGEEKLARLVREALERTGGRPMLADSTSANELARRYRLDAPRANAIVAETHALWTREQKPPPRLGDVAKISVKSGLEIRFTWIPAGTFLMGSPTGEPERGDDEVPHRVTLTRGFYLGTWPITQAQWKAVVKQSPSHFKGDLLPVEQVSWDDCQAFCRKLGEKTGKRFRLPTEAEWEYACRAGTVTPFYFGPAVSTDHANFDGTFPYNGGKTYVTRVGTTPIGHFPANVWGLADMHGNVWEWCQDWYGPYPKGDATDPQGVSTGTTRVLRGGSWCDGPRYCRSAYRYWSAPGGRTRNIGCRIVLCQS